MTQRIFDGHNDALLRLWQAGSPDAFFADSGTGHIDLPRARRGGLVGGLFAAFVPPAAAEPSPHSGRPRVNPTAEIAQADALAATLGQLAVAFRIARRSSGSIVIARAAHDIAQAAETGRFAMVLHLEGAEAVDRQLEALETLYAAGVRSIGPVWSRATVFGTGVPLRFPATPDIGDGLTPAGFDLVRACNEIGIMVDCSHMNAKSFWDVARVSRAPLVATHSNAHAISPFSRNLTDAQMDAIRDTEGVVGLNFATYFLRPDGKRVRETPLSAMTRQLDHMLAKLGPEGVALGSDFDGAPVPAEIGDASGLPRLVGMMRAAGYGEDLIDAICYRNWLSVLSRTIG